MLTSNKTTNHHPKCRDTFGTLLRSKATFDYSKKKSWRVGTLAMKTTATRRVKRAINPLLSSPGGLFQTHLSGGCLFNFAKTIVSVLHKELERGVEKLKYKKVGGHAAEDQKFQLVNKPSKISPHEVLQSWLINIVYHLLVTNNKGQGRGTLKERAGLVINCLPLKREEGLLKRGGLIENLQYLNIYKNSTLGIQHAF